MPTRYCGPHPPVNDAGQGLDRSEGAEFPAVAIPLVNGHVMMLGRTLLYRR